MEHLQQDEVTRLKELLQHTSEFIAYFELAETKMHAWRQDIEQQSLHLQKQQELLTDSLAQIEKQHERTLEQVNTLLNQYDPQSFQDLASQGYEQVKQVAENSLQQSNKLLHLFQFRLNLFAVLTTILTAFIVVLYLNGELPWETHHLAQNERQAGKILLQAWPKLSQEEKTKILGYINHA